MITLLYLFFSLIVFMVSGYEMLPERLQGQNAIWFFIMVGSELSFEFIVAYIFTELRS